MLQFHILGTQSFARAQRHLSELWRYLWAQEGGEVKDEPTQDTVDLVRDEVFESFNYERALAYAQSFYKTPEEVRAYMQGRMQQEALDSTNDLETPKFLQYQSDSEIRDSVKSATTKEMRIAELEKDKERLLRDIRVSDF